MDMREGELARLFDRGNRGIRRLQRSEILALMKRMTGTKSTCLLIIRVGGRPLLARLDVFIYRVDIAVDLANGRGRGRSRRSPNDALGRT
jgi:hypothetical protein